MQKLSLRDRIKEARATASDSFRGGKLMSSIFRPGSPFRKGYVDSPRNRSYVVMNNVLYHLHPVKVKRHGVRLSYTLCLGGLSFFLFIVLTITGIWLMFYFRPTELAYVDIQTLQTSIAFGSLVRNMHRWGAHLMVLVVFLHMSRVFYHGAYKAPREFNWVIGVILLLLTLLLSFTGYLLPWDQLAIWAVTVGGNMAGYTPVIGAQAKFGLFAGLEATTATLLRFYVLHVLVFTSGSFEITVGSDSPFISAKACSTLMPKAFALASADLCNKCSGISTISLYKGPEIPPSFLTLQKWTAIKITMINGKKST